MSKLRIQQTIKKLFKKIKKKSLMKRNIKKKIIMNRIRIAISNCLY